MSGPVAAVAEAAAGALVLADALSEALIRFASRCGLVDRPDMRKAHARPTPHLGGVAIAAGTLVAGGLLVPHWDRRLGAVAAAAGLMALVGLADDVRPVRRAYRLLLESLAAAGVVASGCRIEMFGAVPDAVLTVAWIVVLTNSFNLLDNMDGAAAMTAAGGAGLLGGAAALAGREGLALLMVALSAGCLGFLVHNWAPARMFMGDSGSMFIGFLLASAAVLVPVAGGPVDRVAELFLFTFVATVDTFLVVIARECAGLSWLTAGTDHASHRLHLLGLSVRQVASAMFGVAALSSLCGVGVARGWLPGAGALLPAVAIGVAVIAVLMRVPVYAPAERPAEEPVESHA